jgi:hemolysin D
MPRYEPMKEEFSVFQEAEGQIRILVVDDQHFARKFLEQTIDEETQSSHLKVIGTASNGQQALQQVEFLQPDVVVIDLEMPDMDGISATKIITEKFPDSKVLVLSSYDNASYLHQAFQAGAKGYLLKSTPGEDLRNAILFVNKGYSQIGPGLLEKAFSNTVEITTTDVGESIPAQPELVSEKRWSNSTKELLNTFPQVWSRGLVYLLAIFVMVGLPWTILAKIDETGTARGKIEPKGKTLEIDAPIGGKVTEVSVKEGEKVKAGQELLTIESETVVSELKQQQDKLAAQQNQLWQLEFLKDRHLESIKAQDRQNQAAIIEKQAQLQQARQTIESLKATNSWEKQEKQAQLEQARREIATGQADYELVEIRLKSAIEKIPRYRQAYRDGAISQDRFLETTQLAAETRKEVERAIYELQRAKSGFREIQSSYQTLIAQKAAEIEQAKLRRSEQQGGYDSLLHTNNLAVLQNQEKLQDTETKIATVKGEIAQAKSQIKSLKFQLKQYTIEAPVAGTIFQFPVQNAGATVEPGEPVAAIAQFKEGLPESNFVLRAKMPTSETTFLKTGLPAKIKFDAYPFQDYGIVEGRVSWISPDSQPLSDRESSQAAERGEFFELEITLEPDKTSTETKPIPIAPGQTATAEVVIRQRRLIDFLLDPFKKLRKNGLEL